MCGVCLSCNIRAELKQLNTYLLTILSYTAAHNRRMLCHYHSVYISLHQNSFFFLLFFFSDSVWSFAFSSPPQRPMTSDFEGIFDPRSYPLHLFSYLNSWEKSQYFPFWMVSAKQGHYWYHFYTVFGMTQSLTGDWTRDLPHSKPALYH